MGLGRKRGGEKGGRDIVSIFKSLFFCLSLFLSLSHSLFFAAFIPDTARRLIMQRAVSHSLSQNSEVFFTPLH